MADRTSRPLTLNLEADLLGEYVEKFLLHQRPA
jgi:hypothetical protein